VKSGIGKTFTMRTLLRFLCANGIADRAFDGEFPNGSLKRFHPDRTEIVDLTDSDDQMKVFDTVSDQIVTVIDLPARLLIDTVEMLTSIGFFDTNKYNVIVVHVLGNNKTSADEMPETARRLAALYHGRQPHPEQQIRVPGRCARHPDPQRQGGRDGGRREQVVQGFLGRPVGVGPHPVITRAFAAVALAIAATGLIASVVRHDQRSTGDCWHARPQSVVTCRK